MGETHTVGIHQPAAHGMWGKLPLLLETVRPEHTVFALPFAYMALFLAEGGTPSVHDWLWITAAMTGARFAGMAINRLADVDVDKRIPRNARRALPSGKLKRSEVLLFIMASLGLFVGAAFQFGFWPRVLWPAVIAALAISPYAKRFTAWSNLSIGMVYLLIPSGVWVAVTDTIGLPAVLLGLASALWNTGFDTIYRSQDWEVDRRVGVHSLSADFGLRTALWLARLFHACTAALLLLLGVVLHRGPWYFAGTGLAALLFVYEHSLVSPTDLSKLNRAFLVVNSLIAVTLLLFTIVDTVAR